MDNWLQQNPDLSGTALTDAAQAAGFDPAFIALVNFPQVIAMMAENIDDYTAIGEAFSADQASVTDSIQRLRAQVYDAGALRSNSEMQVEVQKPAASQTVYVIQPANPQVVYVPVYDPTVVYVAPAPNVAAATLITFGAGIAVGALLVDNRPWGWGGLGMELGLAPRLLQSRCLGRMGKSPSSAESLVSSAAYILQISSRIRRQLAISSAKLSSSKASQQPSSRSSSAMEPDQSASGRPQAAAATKAESEAKSKTGSWTEAEPTTKAVSDARSQTCPLAKASTKTFTR